MKLQFHDDFTLEIANPILDEVFPSKTEITYDDLLSSLEATDKTDLLRFKPLYDLWKECLHLHFTHFETLLLAQTHSSKSMSKLAGIPLIPSYMVELIINKYKASIEWNNIESKKFALPVATRIAYASLRSHSSVTAASASAIPLEPSTGNTLYGPATYSEHSVHCYEGLGGGATAHGPCDSDEKDDEVLTRCKSSIFSLYPR